MYIVYSTTKSFALYPVSVLIVAGVPALALNVPDNEVVIPTSVQDDMVVQDAAAPEPPLVNT